MTGADVAAVVAIKTTLSSRDRRNAGGVDSELPAADDLAVVLAALVDRAADFP